MVCDAKYLLRLGCGGFVDDKNIHGIGWSAKGVGHWKLVFFSGDGVFSSLEKVPFLVRHRAVMVIRATRDIFSLETFEKLR